MAHPAPQVARDDGLTSDAALLLLRLCVQTLGCGVSRVSRASPEIEIVAPIFDPWYMYLGRTLIRHRPGAELSN